MCPAMTKEKLQNGPPLEYANVSVFCCCFSLGHVIWLKCGCDKCSIEHGVGRPAKNIPINLNCQESSFLLLNGTILMMYILVTFLASL